MKLNFEAEPLQLEEASHCGGTCSCQHCREGVAHEHESSHEAGAEGESPEGFADFEGGFEDLENDFEATGFEEGPASPAAFDCSSLSVDCQFYPLAYEKKVRKAGNPEGNMLDRTQGDRDQNLALQLSDYDINAYHAGQKTAHRLALTRMTEFLNERRGQIMALPNGVQITISGSASFTGSKAYNDVLSCQRAKCVEAFFRAILDRTLLGKIRFNTSGEGFEKASHDAKGHGEFGEYRSVLVSIHRPEKPPVPVPIEPPGWNKFSVRNCSFKTETLATVIAEELVQRGIDALPDSLKRLLNSHPGGASLLQKGIKALLSKLKSALQKLPGVAGKLAKGVSKLLSEIPVEIIRDTGIFQIVERDKPGPTELVLSYSGFGFRVIVPRELGSLPIPDAVMDRIKKLLKDALRLDDFGVDILDAAAKGKIPDFDSTTPGAFTHFDTSEKVKIKVFEGAAEALKGLKLGTVFLGFDSRRFTHPDPAQRVKLLCKDCSASIVPVKIGAGTGFEVVAPTKGRLTDCLCKCETPVKAANARLLTASRPFASRPQSAVRTAAWSARLPAAKPTWSARRPVPVRRPAAPRRPA